MNTARFAKLFPLGTHLCREPMPPMSEMKHDLELLRAAGFNLVKLQEHWMIDEPEEGRFDFSRYEELIDHAAKLDLGIYLGFTCEQAPHWLYLKYPDCRMVGRNGQLIVYEAVTTLPADGKPGPCFDHAGAVAAQRRFLRKAVEVLGRFENVVVWNTWQEIGYWADGLVSNAVCFCPHTLKAFQQWLQEKFHDLDALNRAWNTRYLSWPAVLPSQAQNARGPNAVDISWHYFMDNVQVATVLRERAEAIRAADPLHRPVFAHRGGPVIGAGQDWVMARCQDFMGSSCYPAWGSLHSWEDGRPAAGRPFSPHAALLAEMYGVAQRYDHIRSANRSGAPVWAAEFQGGPVSTAFHKGRVPHAPDMRRWMLTAAASGVNAISFWVTRAEIMMAEQNGFSLLDSEGDTTARFEEVARVGRALNAHPELFGQPTWGGAEVAIVLNEWNYQLCMAMGQGGDQLPFDVSGWHRLLWDAGIPVDFIEVSQLGDPAMARYQALVLPFPLSLADSVAEKLAAYVERGGNLISEAAAGRINEFGICNRGELSPVLRRLFGISQRSFTLVREPGGGTRWTPGERTWGEYMDATMLEGAGALAGHRLRANGYIQTFSGGDSEPVLRCSDAVAGVRQKYGSGWAWWLGTFVGHNGFAYRDPETRACIGQLLQLCGVTSPAAGRLLKRRRVAGKKEAWFFTNPHPETVRETIDVSGWHQVSDLFGAPLVWEGTRVILPVDSLDVRVLVLEA